MLTGKEHIEFLLSKGFKIEGKDLEAFYPLLFEEVDSRLNLYYENDALLVDLSISYKGVSIVTSPCDYKDTGAVIYFIYSNIDRLSRVLDLFDFHGVNKVRFSDTGSIFQVNGTVAEVNLSPIIDENTENLLSKVTDLRLYNLVDGFDSTESIEIFTKNLLKCTGIQKLKLKEKNYFYLEFENTSYFIGEDNLIIPDSTGEYDLLQSKLSLIKDI